MFIIKKIRYCFSIIVFLILIANNSNAAIIKVGPGKTYTSNSSYFVFLFPIVFLAGFALFFVVNRI